MQWCWMIGDKPRQAKRQGQAAKTGLTRRSRDAMAAKNRAAKNPRYGKAKTPPALSSRSFESIAAQNLVNMVAIVIASGAVLLGLLLVKHL
jgi:hypothetical protein